jgi:enamine deaminase RidA (YjgF/YER057c/UK114 family)
MRLNKIENIEYMVFKYGSIGEYFLSAQCYSEQESSDTVDRLFSFLRAKHASPVSMRIFVKKSFFDSLKAICSSYFEPLHCPVNWLAQADKPAIPAASFEVHAVAGTDIQTMTIGNRKAGCWMRDSNAEYFYLHMLSSPDSHEKYELTRAVFENMRTNLLSAGIGFSRTVRTWLFADDILAWYDKLNRGRDYFFEQHQIFNKLIPASTGIGIANPLGSALAADVLAVRPLNGEVRIKKVVSPLQCEPLAYKSSFSRAVCIQTPDHDRLYVSGTAGIAPDGTTAYVGNCAGQIDLTMAVVEALIANCSMDWSDSTRAIAYFKNCQDFELFDLYCRTAGLHLPHLKVEADICRDDLLFELELDLVSYPD